MLCSVLVFAFKRGLVSDSDGWQLDHTNMVRFHLPYSGLRVSSQGGSLGKWSGCVHLNILGTVHGFPGCSAGKESAGNAGDLGLIPGLGRSPGDGNC